MATMNPTGTIDGATVDLTGNQLIRAANTLLDEQRDLLDELMDAYRSSPVDIAAQDDTGWFTERLELLTVLQHRIAALCEAYRNRESLDAPVEWLVGD